MTTGPFRVGCLGAGRVFNEAHLPAYLALDSVRLAAIYDPSFHAAETTRAHYLALSNKASAGPPAAEPEVRICESPDELLAQVDLVDICSPARYHARYAVMALERGRHVMTEKPMARTWWEAHRVAQAARKSSAYFQLNDDNVFLPRYRALRNVIDDGMIGEVQHIWIARGYHGPEERGDWFWDPLENGGGSIMDYGSHAVASVWFLVGLEKVPVEVRSLGIQARQRMRLIGGRFRMIETDDDAQFKVRFVNPGNGDWSTALVEATWSWTELGPQGSDVRGYLEVEGSLGTVTGMVDEHDQDCLRVRRRAFGERLIAVEAPLSDSDVFRLEIDNFVKCIRAGVPSLLNADVGTGVIGILNAAQLSELRGRVSVTPQDVAEFSEQLAADAPDAWQAGDRIISALYAPFRLD